MSKRSYRLRSRYLLKGCTFLKKPAHHFITDTNFLRKAGKVAISAMVAVSLTACGGEHTGHKTIKTKNLNNRVTGYVGSVAADEPQAAMIARDVLIRGGNAADAATALGFALTVTLPSRASLGGGGACIAYRPGQPAQSFLFLPQSGIIQGQADRPAAVPMMARGLYLLQASEGKADINDILHLIGNMAQNGVTVSDIFANDLAAVQGPLFLDAAMQKIFARKDGTVLQAGDMLYQPRLKIIYDRLITSGVSDLYIGSLAHSYALGAQAAGGGLSGEGFRNALPVKAPALSVVMAKGQNVYFVSPSADGGLGMAMAWRNLSNGKGNASAISQGTVAQWRASNGLAFDKKNILAQENKAQSWLNEGKAGSGNLPSLPASTSFSVMDRNGGAVSCALTMNNLFGTGRIAGTTGIVMAASPKSVPQPLLTAAIATYKNRFMAAVSASGQNEAAAAGAEVLNTLLTHTKDGKNNIDIAHPNSPQGRVNAVFCEEGMPGNSNYCRAYTDPSGSGLAISRR
ncbi:gamma-glutamyltransferase [Commensalibacter oyaizuii]|uniref:Gamma-glutamyltransferase n=1 Tax=Commensalibacter oyaizuii TaxID=3043873 RepID=A0ABT6Q1N2_9PROT|nr:gamma-glutamyltransferase [Commensalibacter sp. TBRC 16381]MDI2090888.1 gamma-glutamyltransferase [Commensalibacter sp. TBRC 16381]